MSATGGAALSTVPCQQSVEQSATVLLARGAPRAASGGRQVGQEAGSGHQGSCRQRAMGFLLRYSKQICGSTGPDVSSGVLASKVSLEKGHQVKHASQMSSFHPMGSPEPWESLFGFTELMLKGFLSQTAPPPCSSQQGSGNAVCSCTWAVLCTVGTARAAQAPPGLGSHGMHVPTAASTQKFSTQCFNPSEPTTSSFPVSNCGYFALDERSVTIHIV